MKFVNKCKETKISKNMNDYYICEYFVKLYLTIYAKCFLKRTHNIMIRITKTSETVEFFELPILSIQLNAMQNKCQILIMRFNPFEITQDPIIK